MTVGRGLLRTHVGGRAQREAGLRQALAGGVHGSGDAEVGEHASLALEQDVLRLDVAMDDALPLGVSQRVGHRPGDPQRVRQRELGLARQAVPERLALHVGHGEPEPAGRFTGVVDRQDVRVVEPGGEPDLPDEPLGAQRVRQLGMEDLQGDGAVVPEIAGEIDRGHAATAELALEQVAVGQGGLEPFEGLGQRDIRLGYPKPKATVAPEPGGRWRPRFKSRSRIQYEPAGRRRGAGAHHGPRRTAR